jgi:hypothetical protein
MKVAIVTLVRDVEEAAASVFNVNYTENVRGFSEIVWAPSHIVFQYENGNVIAYKADRVFELVVTTEDE